MLYRFIAVSAFGLTFGIPGKPIEAQQTDTTEWLADFADLQREMSLHYSTFQWQVRTRGLDLRQLATSTRDSIRLSADEAGARRALRRFVTAFADGHFTVRWPQPGSRGPGDVRQPLCVRLGYDGEPPPPGISFNSLRGYRSLPSLDSIFFPAGILSDSGRRVGVVRIGLFEQLPFPSLCDSALRTLAIAPDAPCDGACENRIDVFTGDLLTEALVRQLQLLQRERIHVLAVDVTGNPGGNDWNEPAARVLTSRAIHGSRYGFIRHEHWATILRRRLATLEGDTAGLSVSDRNRIEVAKRNLRQALEEALTSCNLQPMWNNDPVACSLMVDRPLYVTGLLPYAAPGSLVRRPSTTVLFAPSRYRYREGEYSGPLWIIVDDRSASSAERFTAMLRDNDAALVIGLPTFGAGCGYTNGGIRVRLPRTGAEVRMPDCFQFRADMTSVGDGITPDLLVPWRASDTPRQRADRLLAVLRHTPLAP